jgi:indolepyruvate ferredoxin oxidoreductase alpha subunit
LSKNNTSGPPGKRLEDETEMEKILSKKTGEIIPLLGNEAIVRGALEAGVQFVSTYPGTPASEIGNIFYKISKKAGAYFEYSVNEKVAMEAGIGASFSGLKTMVAMKHFGLNVCAEALLPFVYTGSKGPFVLFVADDPGCWSSAQSEQNSRAYSYLAHIPTLEPSDPQECKDFIKKAFEISEKFKIPVMVRTTTRVSHQRMPVKLGKFGTIKALSGKFVKDRSRFVTLPPRVMEMKEELLEKEKKIKEFAEKGQNPNVKGFKKGIIASGISYLYVLESLKELGTSLPVLKLDFFYPFCEEKVKKFISSLKEVLVAEELEPFLEKEVQRTAKEANCKLKIQGKNLLPETGELKPEDVTAAVAKLLNKKYSFNKGPEIPSPKRFPQLCPGCPYWLVFGGVKKAVDEKKVIFGGDIGCYMLGGMPPHNLQDFLSCMGSSIGITHGIKKSNLKNPQKTISFIGDSTFFHSGIPALINAVFNKSNPLIIIMDNSTTAMTGHQPNPAAPTTGQGIKIYDMVRACGVKNVKIADPANQKEFIETIRNFINKKEVSVIISKHPCKFAGKK